MKRIRVSGVNGAAWGDFVYLGSRFAPMVERLEQVARHSPEGYRGKVVAAGLLGYAVLGTTLLILVGVALAMLALLFNGHGVAAVEIKVLIVFGLLAVGLGRALVVKAPEPDGFEVSRGDYPALFAMIDDARTRTRGPAVHQVRLTDQLNAAITQQPSFLFLGSRNILYLGVPLLMGMRAGEVKAVVAHELGHFVGRHGRSAGFVYGIRMRWAQVAERLPDGIVSGLLRRFFNWYGPWFAAYSFALARQQEYDADQVAASIAGADAVGSGLKRLTVQSDRQGRFWTDLWKLSANEDTPPERPFLLLAEHLKQAGKEDQRALADELAAPSRLDDTHPSLSQRLNALNCPSDMPQQLDRSAAEDFLGHRSDDVISRLDSEWHGYADETWRESHISANEERAELETLEAKVGDERASADETFRLGILTEQFFGPEAAVGRYRDLLEKYPDYTDARFRLGELLLEAGDSLGRRSADRCCPSGAEPSLPGLLPHRPIPSRRTKRREGGNLRSHACRH